MGFVEDGCLRSLGGGCAGCGVVAVRRKGFLKRGAGEGESERGLASCRAIRQFWGCVRFGTMNKYNMSMFSLSIDTLPWFCNLRYIFSK